MRSFGLKTKSPSNEEIADIRTVIYVRDLLKYRVHNLNLVNSYKKKVVGRSIDASAIDESIRNNYPELASVMDRYFND